MGKTFDAGLRYLLKYRHIRVNTTVWHDDYGEERTGHSFSNWITYKYKSWFIVFYFQLSQTLINEDETPTQNWIFSVEAVSKVRVLIEERHCTKLGKQRVNLYCDVRGVRSLLLIKHSRTGLKLVGTVIKLHHSIRLIRIGIRTLSLHLFLRYYSPGA